MGRVVVKLPPQLGAFSDFQQLLVAQSAAAFFKEAVLSGKVALSGGSTLLQFARCMTFDEKLSGLTFYPLDINPLADQVELDASSIIALLKVKLNCDGFALHHHVMGSKFNPKELSDQAYEVLFRGAKECSFALVGVGNPLKRITHRLPRPLQLSSHEMKELGVVADLLFKLLKADGTEVEHRLNERLASLPLNDLKEIARAGFVVGVVQGLGKTQALRAVLKGEYLSGLVTHDALAKAVLAET